jgi:hypothetical protein
MLGIDSKLRACDLLQLGVRDVCHADRVAARAIVLQQKTQHPVQFEITSKPGRHKKHESNMLGDKRGMRRLAAARVRAPAGGGCAAAVE